VQALAVGNLCARRNAAVAELTIARELQVGRSPILTMSQSGHVQTFFSPTARHR